nr:ectonucleoside triphosphate diphosphohydrolase 3 isoform X3 [Globicephala melas]
MFTVLTRQPCEQAGLKALSRISAIITLVVLLLSIVVLVAVTLIQIHQKEVLLPGLKYGIVLDAGSSRTTVYVYQWPAEKENNTGVVSQTFKCSVKGSGISSYGENPQDAPKAFEDCMQEVKGHIPAHLHGSTCIYLGATAGMRLLRLQNETAANEVIASIQNYFESQPFDFRDAQIISGQEEGIYGWITANYLMGNFLEKSLWHMWVHPNGKETTGALDLGGASTQISFAVEENVGLNTSDIVKVSLYGYEYTLYTHSFQCYGRNEAEKRFLAILLQNYTTETTFANPCYPRNYNTTFTEAYVFGSLCTEDLRPESYDPNNIITFEGTGDPSLCREKVASLFNFSACHDREVCSFNGVYQPKVKRSFLVGNSSIAWSLGYMLSLTNQIPAESPLIRLPIKPSAFMGTLTFFTAVALLCLTYLMYLCVSSRNQRRSQHALDNTVDSE